MFKNAIVNLNYYGFLFQTILFGSGFLSTDYKLCYEHFLLLFQIIKELAE